MSLNTLSRLRGSRNTRKWPGIMVLVIILSFLTPTALSGCLGPQAAAAPDPSRYDYAVPRMTEPVFDGEIGAGWHSAQELNVSFWISVRNSSAYQEIQGKIMLGHNQASLFVRSVLFSVGLNPYTGWQPDGVHAIIPDVVRLMFDVPNDVRLTFPEDGKTWYCALTNSGGDYSVLDGWWGDLYYGQESTAGRAGWDFTSKWALDDSNSTGNGTVFDPVNGHFMISTNAQGDEITEISIPLQSNDTYDGLNLEKGKVHYLGLCAEFVRQGDGYDGKDLFDDWPGEGFTPQTCMNPLEFARLMIDLR